VKVDVLIKDVVTRIVFYTNKNRSVSCGGGEGSGKDLLTFTPFDEEGFLIGAKEDTIMCSHDDGNDYIICDFGCSTLFFLFLLVGCLRLLMYFNLHFLLKYSSTVVQGSDRGFHQPN